MERNDQLAAGGLLGDALSGQAPMQQRNSETRSPDRQFFTALAAVWAGTVLVCAGVWVAVRALLQL